MIRVIIFWGSSSLKLSRYKISMLQRGWKHWKKWIIASPDSIKLNTECLICVQLCLNLIKASINFHRRCWSSYWWSIRDTSLSEPLEQGLYVNTLLLRKARFRWINWDSDSRTERCDERRKEQISWCLAPAMLNFLIMIWLTSNNRDVMM